jgi:hypothetical protein
MKAIIRFICCLNGVFEPKSPMDSPEYDPMMDISLDSRDIRKSLKRDMAAFGSDFKKATKMAKQLING